VPAEGDSSCDGIYAQSENLPCHASCASRTLNDDFGFQSSSNGVSAPKGAVDFQLSGRHTPCEEKDDSRYDPPCTVSLAEYENKCKSKGYSSSYGRTAEESNGTISKIEHHHGLLKMKRKDQSTFMARVTA
jgi:hypothetical protein